MIVAYGLLKPLIDNSISYGTLIHHRLNGIGSTPGNPDCQRWDDWSVSYQMTIPCRHVIPLTFMSVLRRRYDSIIEAGHACFDGCFAELLFLDMEDRQFLCSRDIIFSSLALPIRPAARLDSDRYFFVIST
jgi:hypothetical protein